MPSKRNTFRFHRALNISLKKKKKMMLRMTCQKRPLAFFRINGPNINHSSFLRIKLLSNFTSILCRQKSVFVESEEMSSEIQNVTRFSVMTRNVRYKNSISLKKPFSGKRPIEQRITRVCVVSKRQNDFRYTRAIGVYKKQEVLQR